MTFSSAPEGLIRFLFSIGAIYLLGSCSGMRDVREKSDCSELQNGRFLFKGKLADTIVQYEINRNGNLQTEVNLSTGDTTTLEINWFEDCKYRLKFVNTTAKISTVEIEFKKAMLLECEVLKTHEDYYVFRTSSTGSSHYLQDTLWRDNGTQHGFSPIRAMESSPLALEILINSSNLAMNEQRYGQAGR